MRHLLIASMIALGAGPVAAQDSLELDFPVIGTVPQLCILGSPEITSANEMLNVATLSSNRLRIEQLTSPETLTTEATRVEVSLSAVCNAQHVVSLTSAFNGLWRGTASETPKPGFATAVPYRATLEWGDEGTTLVANAQTRKESSASLTSAAEAGPLTLVFSILPGETNANQNEPLVAGVYTDTLTIKVEPR